MNIDRIHINNRGIEGQGTIERAQGKDSSRSNKAGGPSASAEDAVSLSSQAIEMTRVAQQVGQAADIRADRVNRVRQAIEAGTYNVSGEDIARKLIDAHKQ